MAYTPPTPCPHNLAAPRPHVANFLFLSALAGIVGWRRIRQGLSCHDVCWLDRHADPLPEHPMILIDPGLPLCKAPPALMFHDQIPVQRCKPNSRLPSVTVLEATHCKMHPASTRGRHGRTFMGGECAACEESLELTLNGERIIQLTCGHITHEACFYEYIKEFEVQTCPSCDAPLRLDTSRGGASIDFQNLNRLVRSLQVSDHQTDRSRTRDPVSLPRAIEFSNRCSQTYTLDHKDTRRRLHRSPRKKAFAHDRTESNASPEKSVKGAIHAPSVYSAAIEADSHDQKCDVQITATVPLSSTPPIRNPIPAPTVTVRSEFPTITKSRQQQSLTCLVTVEVTDARWPMSPQRSISHAPSTPESPHSRLRPPQSPVLKPVSPVDSVHQDDAELHRVKDDLLQRMDHWHGMEYVKFDNLLLHGRLLVGKDGHSWQDLDCYLFTDMLICVKERRLSPQAGHGWDDSDVSFSKPRYTLKGSILIKKHLRYVGIIPESYTLILNLSVVELPVFHLQFSTRQQLNRWHDMLDQISHSRRPADHETQSSHKLMSRNQENGLLYQTTRNSSNDVASPRSGSHVAGRSEGTSLTEQHNDPRVTANVPVHVSSIQTPLDIVVVVPISSSMQGLKSNLLRDALRFLVASLGDRDRMGVVTFGSGNGCVPLVDMTAKTWSGWYRTIESIRTTIQKHTRTDAAEGTNTAIDLLMQRKASNTLASILLISDSPNVDHENANSVVLRAETAKIPIHTFGLGLSHQPDTLVKISTGTKALYTYVKDWMMLRECLAGCLGLLQSSSHQDVKLKLRLPSGSPAKLVKASGGLGVTKSATGRDIEVLLGDLHFGDKRDILVQLVMPPNSISLDLAQIDPWSNVVAGLEALGSAQDENEPFSTEEIPLIQADLSWGDFTGAGRLAKLSQPSLLAITALSPLFSKSEGERLSIPALPPHPSIVQRRMEMLSSDMLTRALSLVSQGKHDRAEHLLTETRSILKGLAKGSLPPLPPPPNAALPATPPNTERVEPSAYETTPVSDLPQTPSPASSTFRFSAAPGIDLNTMLALDRELGASLEWISHPTVFIRDSRKAILQAIGTISTQRAFTFRTPAESLWATRIAGVQRLAELNAEWREMAEDGSLTEEV
nr:hypothetical protein CFP56_24640 [Quercus suber]